MSLKLNNKKQETKEVVQEMLNQVKQSNKFQQSLTVYGL